MDPTPLVGAYSIVSGGPTEPPRLPPRRALGSGPGLPPVHGLLQPARSEKRFQVMVVIQHLLVVLVDPSPVADVVVADGLPQLLPFAGSDAIPPAIDTLPCLTALDTLRPRSGVRHVNAGIVGWRKTHQAQGRAPQRRTTE